MYLNVLDAKIKIIIIIILDTLLGLLIDSLL